jgi:ankyrin repeat protein
MNPISPITPSLPRRHSSVDLKNDAPATSPSTSRQRSAAPDMPGSKTKDALSHLDLAARDTKIKQLREKFVTADHRMHLAKQAQAAEVVAKLLLKSVNADGEYPLRAGMSNCDQAAVAAIFEQLKMAKPHLTQGQQVELINGRLDSKKDQAFSSLAGVALVKDTNPETAPASLDGAILPLLDGLLAMKPSEDTIVKVFTADNFGGEYSPMMVAAMTENPLPIIELGAVLGNLKADGLIDDAGLVRIFSKRDAQGDSVMDNAMLGGNKEVIKAIFEGMEHSCMSGEAMKSVLGFAGDGNGALGSVMNPLAKNIINNKDPEAIEAYASGLKELRDHGIATYNMTAVLFNKATMRAMLTGNVDAVNKLGDVMRRVLELKPEDTFTQLNAKEASGKTILQHNLENGDTLTTKALCDQLIQTDASKAQSLFESIPEFGIKSEQAKKVLSDAIHAPYAAQSGASSSALADSEVHLTKQE